MAITKSAKKALRQNKKRNIRNRKKKDKIKELLKKAQKLLAENKKEEAKKLLPDIYKALDKATKTNVLKKNTASRRKSGITKLLNKKN